MNFNSPFAMVIFGATGDLSQNKLIPSLFSLFTQKKLPDDFFIVGFSRRSLNEEEFRAFFKNLIHKKGWDDFAKHLIYQQGNFEDKGGYLNLIEKLKTLDDKIGACVTRFFYLATPPDNYEKILDFLKSTKLAKGCKHESPQTPKGSSDSRAKDKWTRIIIEKPFGKDLETAISLDKKLAAIFEEKQIFRVDHYLGKETLQNMVAFRFANGIFEPIWNKKYIDHVQITWAEEKGIEGRGKFFDGIGLLRDVAQNHIMQFIAAIAMEQPKSFSNEEMRDERAKVIKSIRPINGDEISKSVVRGQYRGYKDEKDVLITSETETFVAMKLFVDTPRFEGIPFYVRLGKKMPKNIAEISIVFIQTCHTLFKEYGCPEIGNVLTIRIQPDEGISLRIIAKEPGAQLKLGTVNMHYTYEESFQTQGVDAYEKILLDIFKGDQMLFNRSDELGSSWNFITKILRGWDLQARRSNFKIPIYSEKSWGVKEGFDLIEKDGRKWTVA